MGNRIIFSLLILIACFSCNSQENNNIIASNQYLIGKWVGNGKFLDESLKDYNPIHFEIEINNDNTITGKVGDALLTQTTIKKATNFKGFEIYGTLSSKIRADKDLNKKHLIILLEIPKDPNNAISNVDADFHLKSNFTFDFAMKVGNVQLVLTK